MKILDGTRRVPVAAAFRGGRLRNRAINPPRFSAQIAIINEVTATEDLHAHLRIHLRRLQRTL